MSRRNFDRYTAADWRQAAPRSAPSWPTAGWSIPGATQWALSSPRKRGRIARERGPGFVLWGRATTCRRMGCPGRVTFWVRPHGASGDVAMT